MSRPAKTFSDRLDEYLETATAQEVRDVAVSVATYARWKKLDFKVEVKPIKQPTEPKAQSQGILSTGGEPGSGIQDSNGRFLP